VTPTIAHDAWSDNITARKKIAYLFSDYGFNIKAGMKTVSAKPDLCVHSSRDAGLGELACHHQSIL